MCCSLRNPIHSFADDATHHWSLSYCTPGRENTNIEYDHCIASLPLNTDLEDSTSWSAIFDSSKASLLPIFLRLHSSSSNLSSDTFNQTSKDPVSLLSQSINSSLCWSSFVYELSSRAGRKIGFLYRTRRFFTPTHIILLHKAQILFTLEYCSHVWSKALSTSLFLLGWLQRRAIRITDYPLSTSTLTHRRVIVLLSLFYRYYSDFCSSELVSVALLPVTFSHSSRTRAFSYPCQVSVTCTFNLFLWT